MDKFASDLIDALGGTSATARLVSTPISTVHSWRSNGIPQAREAHIRLAAEAAGLAEAVNEVDASHGRSKCNIARCDTAGDASDLTAGRSAAA